MVLLTTVVLFSLLLLQFSRIFSLPVFFWATLQLTECLEGALIKIAIMVNIYNNEHVDQTRDQQ